MAKATTPHPIHGKIGNLIYTVRNGKQFVHEAPEHYVFRQGTPAHGLNRREFAGAAKIACEIYSAIKAAKPGRWPAKNPADAPGPIFKAYSQNILTAQLKKSAAADAKRKHRYYHFADRFLFRDAVAALKGLDLSRDKATAALVSMVPIGPQHNPTAIRIQGLENAADRIQVNGNARLELRFHIRQANFVERFYCKDREAWVTRAEMDGESANAHSAIRHISPPSDWIPVEIIPREGFCLELPEWAQDAKYLTTVLVEWREVRNVGNKVTRHHDCGIVRIVALHAPAEAWKADDDSAATKFSTAAHHSAPMAILNGTAKPRINPRAHPKTYIAAALARMRPT
ncbi:MAG TPA: hypothetical protein VHS96_18290 [Bacteroidia bacterium]|nr:hypothetical protein [Bacteroidia bacterium]